MWNLAVGGKKNYGMILLFMNDCVYNDVDKSHCCYYFHSLYEIQMKEHT